MTKILHGRDMNIQSRRYVIPISSFVWENMHCSRAVWHLVEYGMKQTLLPVSFYIRYPNNVKWFIVTDNRHSLKYLCICLIICLSVVVFFFFFTFMYLDSRVYKPEVEIICKYFDAPRKILQFIYYWNQHNQYLYRHYREGYRNIILKNSYPFKYSK